MTKWLVIFSIIVVISGVIYLYRTKNNKETISYNLNGKTFKLYVARNEGEWERGLMFYRKLEGVQGMIFLFPGKENQIFWNKNTFMNLDIYWISDKKIVGKDFLPSIEKSHQLVYIYSPVAVDTVIEIAR